MKCRFVSLQKKLKLILSLSGEVYDYWQIISGDNNCLAMDECAIYRKAVMRRVPLWHKKQIKSGTSALAEKCEFVKYRFLQFSEKTGIQTKPT